MRRVPPKSSATASNELRSATIDELTIDDEADLDGVAIYADLKEVLRRARYSFRILPPSHASRWDRALFLNLTYWAASEGGDILVDDHIAADVVAHVAWHHLAAKAVGASSAHASFLGESIASAFDLYLVGRLLGLRGGASFLETQVPAMAEAANAAGLPARKFEKLLGEIAADPERAFEDLRALLFTAASTLHACRTPAEAHAAFTAFDGHRFGALLHHYELSNWILFTRAHASADADPRVAEVDRALATASREDGDALAWLETTWIAPALR